MRTVLVQIRVQPVFVEAFLLATRENQRHSRQEPGIETFDILQQADDPTRFVIVETFCTADAPAAHKETAHYQTWRDAVAGMMAEPRNGVAYNAI